MFKQAVMAAAVAGLVAWAVPTGAQAKLSFDEVMKAMNKCAVGTLDQLLTGKGAGNNQGQVSDASSFASDASTITSADGTPVIVPAAATDCVQGVHDLLNAGADATQTDKDGNTALHMAAASSTLDMVKLLIDKHADVNAKNAKGETPLMLAQNNNYKGKTEQRDKIIDYLKKKGAK
jgi:hypothetical protein